jgi:hypothetical protein
MKVVGLNRQKMDHCGSTRPFFYDLKMPLSAKKKPILEIRDVYTKPE